MHAESVGINPLNAELNPICHLLGLLGAHHILHVRRIRVKLHKQFTAFTQPKWSQTYQSSVQVLDQFISTDIFIMYYP